MIIGLAFDMAGYLLMSLPYLFFWDYSDEKHTEIMQILRQRAEEAAAEDAEILSAGGDAVAVSQSGGQSDPSGNGG